MASLCRHMGKLQGGISEVWIDPRCQMAIWSIQPAHIKIVAQMLPKPPWINYFTPTLYKIKKTYLILNVVIIDLMRRKKFYPRFEPKTSGTSSWQGPHHCSFNESCVITKIIICFFALSPNFNMFLYLCNNNRTV